MSNEGKACDAVIRILETRGGHARTDVVRPHASESGQRVELTFKLGHQRFAIEHTRVEAFPNQIQTGQEFSTFILPVQSALDGALPRPGVYRLMLPLNTRVGSARRVAEAQRTLIQWVRENAQKLWEEQPSCLSRDRQPNGYHGTRQGIPPGLKFEVRLTREVHWARSGVHDGLLTVARWAPDDVEIRRRLRIAKALEDKCPKLRCRKVVGARTILVLESDDIALSNYVVIGEALRDALSERVDQPDEVYVISTDLDPWQVWAFKINDDFNLDVPAIEFQSRCLVDLMVSA